MEVLTTEGLVGWERSRLVVLPTEGRRGDLREGLSPVGL